MAITKVEGKNKGELLLFALSTCIWCRKTREFLNEMGVEYSYVYMDLLEDDEKEDMRGQLKKWNPDCSYPTLVVNGSSCVVGFDEEAIKKELS